MAFKSSLRPKSSRQSISRFLTNEGYTEVQTPPHERTSGGGTKRAWKVPTYAVLMIAQAAVTLALEG
ncbi:Aminoacyl-tRNA synthetase, class II (D/K/N) [Ascosphaera apis ARSEF 7405]|uniref:Aminoacyl-tRNA synthetase, class II (D/K/N) n=1 Tax=Ascosphaera apis ARSEF 7405 TaxID=392613 RepID=A0A168DP33_9EURO|nr:Aminoacyl-tRNA synthetase, class II (D/K/N) [Ascosphaera apis ARSEF 7405]